MDKLVIFSVNDVAISKNQIDIDFNVIDELSLLISNLSNNNFRVVLVSAGAILMGIKKTGLSYYPEDVVNQQTLAAIGQVDLIKAYQSYFQIYGHKAAQVLLTRSIIHSHTRIKNAKSTINALLNMNIIPIINENDIVSSEDIESRNNYPLAATVANLLEADYLVARSDDQPAYTILQKNNNLKITATDYEEIIKHLEDTSSALTQQTRSRNYPTLLA